MTPRSRQKSAARRLVFESRAIARHLGDTLMTVLQHAHVPVLVARGERSEVRRVLICTAAGEPGKNDVREGGRLARRLGATVTLLYVSRGPGVNALTSSHLDRAAATLKSIDVNAEVRIRSAPTPVDGIMSEIVEGDHDLIVIGAHGPRSRSRFKLNDVMLQILSIADRHVLVVPADRA
jgi:nucleotide-binding universal stress UspA family protein